MTKHSETKLIFIHGYGNSSRDYKKFLGSKEYSSIKKEVIQLSGHDSFDDDYLNVNWSRWLDQVHMAVQRACNDGQIPYLVGHSLGATLAIDCAGRDNRVAGVLAISAFLGFSRKNKLLLNLISRIKPHHRKRREMPNKKTFRNERRSEYFEMRSLARIEKIAERVQNIAETIYTRILFIHSTDDDVADFSQLRSFAVNSINDFYICQLHDGAHDLIYEADADKLIEFALCFFEIDRDNATDQPTKDDFIESEYKEISGEHRLWADILFRLISTFLIGFSALLYYSLGDVLQKKIGGMYYLMAYSSLISLYSIIANLYIFYTFRTQHFLANFFHPFDYHKFKANSFISGKWSFIVTYSTYLAVAVLPFCLNSILFISIFSIYGGIISEFQKYYFAWIWISINFGLVAFAFSGMINVIRYDNTVFRNFYKGKYLSKRQYNAEKRFIYSMGR